MFLNESINLYNYIQGQSEWDFDIHYERGLIRCEIIGNLSGQELGKIVGWCYNKMGKIGNNEFRLEIDSL
ncbi:hypothetical protein LCGC14_1003440 [marine sediment metagenome]|uniref:Uncharacterized protein n=1 Tax=marine sediment metagenome TaxID=412755 RepID=A0A0F9N713_9ZZZZ